MIIPLNIPDEKAVRFVVALNGKYPCPQILDPEWDGDPLEEGHPMIAKFAPSVWAKKVIARWLNNEVYLWETSEASKAATTQIPREEFVG